MPQADENVPTGAELGDVRLDVVTRAEEFAGHAAPWRALEARSPAPIFFQSFAWCAHVADSLLATSAATYVPLIARLERNGDTIALWPLSLQGRHGARELANIDMPFGQFAGILAPDQRTADALVHTTLVEVGRRGLARLCRFERVIVGSHLHRALVAAGATAGAAVGAPLVELAQSATFEALKHSRNSKTMKNLRNANNRLERAGKSDHRVMRGADVDGLVARTLGDRLSWLDATGLTAPAFRSPAHDLVMGDGHRWGLEGQRIGFELLLDDKPIAHQWGFVHAKRYYAYMSGMAAGGAELSAGRIHLARVMEAAMAEGCAAAELLTPAAEYKLVWTDTQRALVDMTVALTARARLHDMAWNRMLRPAVKRVFYALPPALRRRALAMFKS